MIEEQVRDWQKSGYYLKTKINSGSIYYIQQNNKFTIWLKSDADAVSAKISNLSKEIKDLKIIPFWQPAILWQLTDAPIIPEKQIPQISFKKINSVKYQVNIENVPDPYTLIFSQSFHPGWHLYYQKKQISQNTHQLVNGFANAWQITPQMVEENEDYQLTLKFQPQRLFYLGLIIAAATLLIAIGYMFWHATSKV